MVNEDFRIHKVQETARTLAENILNSEPHNKNLHETRWKEYMNSLNSHDMAVAIQAFKNKFWGSSENG